MSHELLGERFLNRGTTPAWHELGRQFPEGQFILASEAAAQVAGDVVVGARELFFKDSNGLYVPIEENRAIVREAVTEDPVQRVFGITSDRWTDFAYAKLAEVLDPLSRELRVETAGLIKEGRILFMCFEGPDYDVMGDPCNSFLTVNLSQLPKLAHEARLSTIRVVCKNTNDLSRRLAKINLTIPHHANQAARLVLAAEIVKAYGRATEQAKEVFEQFAKTPIDTVSVSKLIENVWKNPDLPVEIRLLERAIDLGKESEFRSALPESWDEEKVRARHQAAVDRIAAIRGMARHSFASFEPTKLAGTVWAAYNAVTETADWREGRNASVSSFVGERYEEKIRGFEEACVLAGVKSR